MVNTVEQTMKSDIEDIRHGHNQLTIIRIEMTEKQNTLSQWIQSIFLYWTNDTKKVLLKNSMAENRSRNDLRKGFVFVRIEWIESISQSNCQHNLMLSIQNNDEMIVHLIMAELWMFSRKTDDQSVFLRFLLFCDSVRCDSARCAECYSHGESQMAIVFRDSLLHRNDFSQFFLLNDKPEMNDKPPETVSIITVWPIDLLFTGNTFGHFHCQ